MILDKADPPVPADMAQEAPPSPPKGPAPPSPPTEEQPPPYNPQDAPNTSNAAVASNSGRPQPTRQTSHLQQMAQQEINYLVLDTRHSSISGSYILNTELPASQLMSHRRRYALDRKNKKHFRDKEPPNMSVHARHGSIHLDLATGGQTNAASRAHVQVSSQHGRIHVNLHALQENKHVCLEVSTRSNLMVVYIPKNFRGALKIRTVRGNIKFLPEFQRLSRLVNASDSDALVLFGQGLPPQVDLSDASIDSCLLSSRHGRIIVGVSGVDHFDEVPGGGLMEKISELSMALFENVSTMLLQPLPLLQAKAEEATRVLQARAEDVQARTRAELAARGYPPRPPRR
ncbi:hypothetical protein BXZ70DRAFT_1010450 [Cristinia sonorae]|uniref:DUF7330 domain-containing protein n=1 Tax=Cristinia sonorae TaxID=1940300 RepID=A0A8K0UKK0_9AGAR|nr:hypothetical protein BXZ70DRAFT_1010450 [Cristinia sonorae]